MVVKGSFTPSKSKKDQRTSEKDQSIVANIKEKIRFAFIFTRYEHSFRLLKSVIWAKYLKM